MRYKWEKNIIILIAVVIFLCFSTTNAAHAQTKSSAANTQKTEKLLAEIIAAVQAEDYNQAKTILQKVLSAAPRDTAANTLAGIIADKENDLIKAEKHFALAAKNSPNAPETRNNYGAILLRLGRKKEAAREFTASLAVNPKQSSALVNLAQIRVSEGNLTEARELFEKVKAIAPDAEILRALVTISLNLRERERAAREFTEYAAALKAESAPFGTGNKTGDVSLAEALLAGGLRDEARQELEFILSIDNRNVNALVLLSKIFVHQKNIAAAGRLLESAVASGLDDARIYLALAEIYEAAGYPENAIPAMRLAIKKEPKNDFYRSRYGLLLVNTKAPAAASVRIEEALKEFPDSASLWFALGIAQFDNHETPKAQKSFEKALSINPKFIQALAYLGAVYVEQARYSDAVKIYEQAIGLNEKIALLHYLLGDTLLNMPDADEKRIEAALRRAVELDADLTSAHSALGRLYVRQTRWTEAAAALERAAKLDPDRAEIFYQLGRVYARLKRADESKATLARFKQLTDAQKQQKDIDRRELVRRLANVRF